MGARAIGAKGSQAMGRLAALWQWFPSMNRLLLLLIVLLGGGIVWDLLLPRSVEINPIQIPPELAEHGYTPEIIARRLSDEVLRIRNQANINKPPGVTKAFEIVPRYEPPSVTPMFDIKVPGSGISLRAGVRFVKQLLGIRSEWISGEITMDGKELHLRLRPSPQLQEAARGWDVYIDLSQSADPNESPQSLIDEADIVKLLGNAAEKIMELTEPSVLALYHFSRVDLSAESGGATNIEDDYKASVNMIQRSLANNTGDDDAFAYNLWGLVKYKKARRHENEGTGKTLLEEAVKMYREALKLTKPKGGTYVIYNNLGTAFFYLKDFEQAIKKYQQVGNLRSASYPNINLGLALLADKKHDRAITHYETYIETHKADPERKEDSASVYYYMGNALIEKMRSKSDKTKCKGEESDALCKRAIKSFSEAAALKSDHSDAYNNWGAVLVWRREYDQAIDIFTRGYAGNLQAKSKIFCDNIKIAIKARDLKEGKSTLADFINEEKRKRKAFEEINERAARDLGEQCFAYWRLQ